MTKQKIDIQKFLIRHMVIIAVIFSSLLTAIWIFSGYLRFLTESEEFRNEYMNSQKAMLRNEVNNVIDYVEYMRIRTEQQLKSELQTRVEEAVAIAENIYQENAAFRSADEIQKMVKDALRPIRFLNGRGYFFAFSMNGVETLFADRPEMEGKNMLPVQGADGEYVVKDMIDMVQKSQQGFYRYTWTKPGAKDLKFQKIAFVKYFEPFDWAIGTGEYFVDFTAHVQNSVLKRISRMRFGTDGYFFASMDGGDPLFTDGKITKGGPRIWEMTDANGLKIIQTQQKVAKYPEGGFVQYLWHKIDDPNPVPKISFVRRIPGWNWTLGAGVYLDNLEAIIAQRKDALRNEFIHRLTATIAVFLVLMPLIWYWAYRATARTRKSMKTFESFFRKAATDFVTIPPDEMQFRELAHIADSANQMIHAHNRSRLELQKAVEERQKYERQFMQAQKMESIGTLAGGIAHDFNNILSSIIGYTELALDDAEKGSLLEENLQEVYTAGKRARDLVKQILIFARKSDEEIQPVQVGIIAEEVLRLIRSTTPATIEIRKKIESDAMVMANPTRIHQIFINLCTNAVHAMEKIGGLLHVCLADLDPEEKIPLLQTAAKSENYIKISVSDTGSGISPDILDTIFEPYFTTQKVGEGSGMGLAVVHGIVDALGGKIRVRSEVGKGTVFEVYLPLTKSKEALPLAEEETLPGGTERILLIDDELPIVKMGRRILEGLGYSVTACTGSLEAMDLFLSRPSDFDMVITDMTMPNMTGDVLAAELIKIRPDIPVILCTGYSKKIVSERFLGSHIRAFIYKPIIRADIAKRVREVLDAKEAPKR